VSESSPSSLDKVIGLGYLAGALYALVAAIESGTWLKLLWWPVALVALATGLGIWRYRRWAWLFGTVGLMIAWMVLFVAMIVAFDGGHGGRGRAYLFTLALVMAALAYFGRYSVERRFSSSFESGPSGH